MLARIGPKLSDNGINMVQRRRSWDSRFWPHATKGYFAFKEQLPTAFKDGQLARDGA
jgi:deoxyribodipyrimidine photo-lyase